MESFGYDVGDYIPSEISGRPAVDIHHIFSRGIGSSKKKDYIENLIALTRDEHEKAESKEYSKEYLQSVHKQFMITKGVHVQGGESYLQ